MNSDMMVRNGKAEVSVGLSLQLSVTHHQKGVDETWFKGRLPDAPNRQGGGSTELRTAAALATPDQETHPRPDKLRLTLDQVVPSAGRTEVRHTGT
jgi:hypothetical protein